MKYEKLEFAEILTLIEYYQCDLKYHLKEAAKKKKKN